MTAMRRFFAVAALLAVFTRYSTARAQVAAEGTPFLYRSHLFLDGRPANGLYDLSFSLCDTAQGNTAAAGPITNSAVKVRNGMFAVTLDFGPGPFTSSNYWLDVSVRTNGGGAFTELTPRRPLTPSPYDHGPQRLVTSVMQLPQPAREQVSSSNSAAPNAKPGTSQSSPP
jgi:hypothetical protein